MDAELSRVLGYSDIKNAESIGLRAVLLVTKYGASQKAAARVLNVTLSVVRSALRANKEGRPIGIIGRPQKLGQAESDELASVVEKLFKEHRSPTKRKIAAEVSPLLRYSSNF